MSDAVVLYGPPAAGKDTVTEALHELCDTYVLFLRLKSGPGRDVGYRMTDHAHLEALRARNEILWSNERYGPSYAIDRTTLTEQLAAHVPVVHAGQPDLPAALAAAIPNCRWHVVYLCALATSQPVASPHDHHAR